MMLLTLMAWYLMKKCQRRIFFRFRQSSSASILVSSLRPDESEDAIVSSCQKLVVMFRQRPEQKAAFVTQHGFMPLMDLLDIPKSRIHVVMSFAGPERDRSQEICKEAAYFLQQLCPSSPLTLQLFIACRGIPVLVGFLEADYAKCREMVHLAIDEI